MIEKYFIFNDIETGFLAAAFVLLGIQTLYYLVSYARPYRSEKKRLYQQQNESPLQPPVSVIIYAKNESVNLKQFLPSVLEQDYPCFEVIVVNDGSTDESEEVLEALKIKYSHLYNTYIPEDIKYLSRRKLALTVAIKAAKHDILLFTDANCRPLSNQWVASMARNFKNGTDIVLGFNAYEATKGFLHRLAAYDNLMTSLQYLSCALNHHPYRGCGKNMAYRKELFFKHKGYYKSLNLHAGDDDLFINEIATPTNTAVELSAESITMITPYERFKVWKEMKVSRAATTRFLKSHALLFYRLETVCNCLLGMAIFALIGMSFYGNWMPGLIGLVIYTIHFLIQATVLKKSSKILRQQPQTAWLPLLEIVQPALSMYVRIYRIFRGKNDYTFRLSK